MKIILVDDHELIRVGLNKVINKEMDMEVVGEAGDASEMFELLHNNEADVLVLDITLPDRSGIDLISEIRAQWPDVKILVLSMHPEDRFALRAMRAGASGYLTKGSAPQHLIEALRKIGSGRKYISADLAEQLLDEIDNDSNKAPHEILSNREFEVMRLISEGKAVSEIADILNISVNTVTSYRSRIMTKMNMKSNAELIRYSLEKKLIT